ncbi:transposase [Candidatus Kaiserbacteria bacterium]|nr:transposase [Candidatus Kaiserbacteria bacterium]
MNRAPFGSGEWYHCFARGIDKRRTFVDRSDYNRFLGLLYLCNNTSTIHRSNLRSPTLFNLLSMNRGKPLVGIGAFCLMPNHFHLLLKEITDGGISAFMQKLGTSYAMYFNMRRNRAGNLFTKPFRSRHISDDRYLQQVLQYIHCNPAELFEPGWKDGRVKDLYILQKKLLIYPYSSFGAFTDTSNVLGKILDSSIFEIETQFSPGKMLKEALEYYRDVKVTP